MSYDSKIASAKQTIETHNNTVEEKNKINWDKFLAKLQDMGGTSDDVLKAVTWEDLKECGVPVILARRLAFVFREQGDGDSGKSSWVSERKASEMSEKQLLERYNPKDVTNPIANRLKSLSKNQPCIVFASDGSVNVEKSTILLKDLQDGLPPIDIYTVDDKPVNVYKIGDRPDMFFDENPVFKGQALRTGEICGQTGVSWAGISQEIRQLVWLAVNHTEEYKLSKMSDVDDLMNIIAYEDGFNKLSKRFRKASLKLDSLKKTGNPPLLKISVNDLKGKSQKENNPFGENKIY